MIEAYVEALLAAAPPSPIVTAYHIELDKRTQRSGLIRGELDFVDRSRLYFRELVDVQTAVMRLMYSFHYQDQMGTLIFRYDDTPHHREVSSFPHHKHSQQEANVLPADPPSLETVLHEIEQAFPYQ